MKHAFLRKSGRFKGFSFEKRLYERQSARYNDSMPTVLRIGRYRFFFYSNEGQEPAHIHVQAGEEEAKFWLQPVALASNHGFRARELNDLAGMVREHEQAFVEAWNAYFGD